MSKNLYITATECKSGKSAVVLGMMQEILRKAVRPAIFRPIITVMDESKMDHDIELILKHFHLEQPYEETYGVTLAKAQEMINSGRRDALIEMVLDKYGQLEKKYDFILCEGTDFLGKDYSFEFELNSELAANLAAPVLFVSNAKQKTADEIIGFAKQTINLLEDKGLDVLAAIFNRVECPDCDTLIERFNYEYKSKNPIFAYAIPERKELGCPTIRDIVKYTNGTVLYGHGQLDTLAGDYLVAAMQIGNFLGYLSQGNLIITPGDRSDIILSCLASRLSSEYPDISGILLSGGLQPPASIHRLIEGWTGVPVPIVSITEHTYQATQLISSLYGRIDHDNQRKINTALGLFESNVDSEELGRKLLSRSSKKVTPKMFEYGLVQKASQNMQRIVLPEGGSERILRASDILLRRKVADLVILGKENDIRIKAGQMGLDLSKATVIDPAKSDHLDSYVDTYFEARKHKGILKDDARDRIMDPTYFGTMMVHMGDADGMVSGSVTTTAQTIRPAFEFIKTKPGFSIVSSVFLMCLKDRVLVFGDCAVNPDPTAEQLAEIAINSSHTAQIFGVEPRVAMLSYSTGASGKGANVEKVIEATRIARERMPELPIEGPLQYDAAIDPEVAATKMPGSDVAGQATVFVFPDLNTGNNTYKAVQRAAGAVAIGPVLQGLNKPVNDLSRGCTVEDIVNTVGITAVQAQAEKGLV